MAISAVQFRSFPTTEFPLRSVVSRISGPRPTLAELLRPHICSEHCPCCDSRCVIEFKPFGSEGPCYSETGHLFTMGPIIPTKPGARSKARYDAHGWGRFECPYCGTLRPSYLSIRQHQSRCMNRPETERKLREPYIHTEMPAGGAMSFDGMVLNR